jgi:hypothetical protein
LSFSKRLFFAFFKKNVFRFFPTTTHTPATQVYYSNNITSHPIASQTVKKIY